MHRSTAGHASSLSPIGLDITDRSVAAVQLAGVNGGTDRYIVAAAWFERLDRAPRPSADEMIRIAEVLERQGFAGSGCVAPVEQCALVTTNIELPARVDTPPGVIAKVELARSSGAAPNEIEAAYWILPSPVRARDAAPSAVGAAKGHLLATGLGHADATVLLDALESATRGRLRTPVLSIVALEPRACALARACRPLLPPHAGHTGISAIVELGWALTTTVVTYQGAVVYSRDDESTSLARLQQAVMEGLSLDEALADHVLLRPAASQDTPVSGAEPDGTPPDQVPPDDAAHLIAEHAQALARELSVSLTYASHRYPDAPVELVLLTGPGAVIANLSRLLAENLGIQVQTVRPADLLAPPADTPVGLVPPGQHPALTVALGLAMYNTNAPGEP